MADHLIGDRHILPRTWCALPGDFKLHLWHRDAWLPSLVHWHCGYGPTLPLCCREVPKVAQLGPFAERVLFNLVDLFEAFVMAGLGVYGHAYISVRATSVPWD